ncbi:flagellar biosynthetic protein FliO [Erythrobacter neustonensis]|uniref:Flagellar biogenesis protein n=1 Tax=Erythrobacter neustonensis TaxID=1112 RepID=A0A192D3V4_9SPHN|nr:flagellar biosynthetic protein FliO [Erythrobacter neustonensis]ANK12592.1 flagellar biogenesis protein [Erythrobacter neustonensis]
MVEYLLRLALLLPVLAGLIWGSLWLTRWLQTRLHGAPSAHGAARRLQLLETSLIAPGMKLAVVRFHDREILLGCTRQGLVRLGETSAATAALPTPALPETV